MTSNGSAPRTVARLTAAFSALISVGSVFYFAATASIRVSESWTVSAVEPYVQPLIPGPIIHRVCSNPSRAGVLAHMSLRIPNGDEAAFAERMRRFSEASSMSYAEVESWDEAAWRNRTIIFQSPEVSVAIDVKTHRNSNIARVTIERTCVTDALEDWRPYWFDFRRFVGESFPG